MGGADRKISLQVMIILACLQKISVLCGQADSLPGCVLAGTQPGRRAAGLGTRAAPIPGARELGRALEVRLPSAP